MILLTVINIFYRFFSEFDIDDAEDKERLFALKLYI